MSLRRYVLHSYFLSFNTMLLIKKGNNKKDNTSSRDLDNPKYDLGQNRQDENLVKETLPVPSKPI